MLFAPGSSFNADARSVRRSPKFQSSSGLSVIEVLALVASVALLVAVAVPGVCGRGKTARAARVNCTFNLKQIGLASRMWANDHGGVFPWDAPMSSNGVKEIALSGDLAALFRSMSNELGTPKILRCLSESKRTREVDWAKLKNNNISYFIGLDADETRPQTILSGDRNISGGVFTSNRIMEVHATNTLVWGADMHYHQGNIALGDGSAQQVSDATLTRQMTAHYQSSTQAVARFAFP